MKSIALLLFVGISFVGYNQDFSYLKSVKLKKAKDYTAHEADVIKCAEYLLSNPADSEDENRFYCNKFVIEYALGSPTVTISVDNLILQLADGDNGELLGLFMGVWLSEALQHPGKEINDYEEIVFTKLATYCADKEMGIDQSEPVKKLIAAEANGTIYEWMEANREMPE